MQSNSGLGDITAIHINEKLPAAKRREQFLAQVKDPHHFRVGSTPVRLIFAGGGEVLADKLAEHFIRQKSQ